MRNRIMILLGALLLVSPGLALAQQDQQTPPPAQKPATTQAPSSVPSTANAFVPKLGSIDFGYRGSDVTGDAARYNRFRDLRDGGYIDRFKINKETETWLFDGRAYNVGYRDQRYTAEFQDIGKLKLKFDYNQTPLFISDVTSTMYKDNGSGVLSIDNGIQQSIQDATAISTAARDNAIRAGLGTASPFDLKSQRNNAVLNMTYTFNRDLDAKFDVRSSGRNGYNLMSFGFGTSPGLNPALEFGVPTDDRTTDVKGMLEFANAKGMFSVGYNGSWYDQHLPTVQFDNPLRAVDINNGPSSGMLVMWPTNSTFSVNLNGWYKLAPRTRASAMISIGQWKNDEPLLSTAVNTALVAPPLERRNTEGKADVTSMVFGFNSRPMESLWLNARFRYFDYANKTPHYEQNGVMIGDWTVNPATVWESEPGSIKRENLDLDASWNPAAYLAFGVGYGHENGDRTFRVWEKTSEDTFRFTIDSSSWSFLSIRAKYERFDRTGSGLDEEVLAEAGEQPDMRHFDVADRKRDRASLLLTVTPVSQLDLNGGVTIGKDKYENSGFGLRDNNNRTWNAGFDVNPTDKVSFGLNYQFEKYNALSYSRSANPPTATDVTFYDARRDWWDSQGDEVKTFDIHFDLLRALPKTDIRTSYLQSYGDASYVYYLKPDQTLFTTTPMAQLSPLKNNLDEFKVDIQHYVRPNIALGGAYWYEKYAVTDFALDAGTMTGLSPVNPTNNTIANTIYSGYLYRPYKANTAFLRMTYLW